MMQLKMSGFGFVTNTKVIDSVLPDGSAIVDCDKIKALPKVDYDQKNNQSWVWVIPTDKDPLPKEVIELIAKIKKDGPEPVSVSFHGFECADITFVANVGSSDGLNDFKFSGDVLIIYKYS